jgi:hypothetical protein
MSNYRRHDESPTEYAERVERAEAEASRWFNDLAAEQIAIFNERMAVARAYRGAPKWDRMKAAADREFKRTTVDASRVAGLVLADMMTAGEVSEATSYAFDEAKVSHAMQQAAE